MPNREPRDIAPAHTFHGKGVYAAALVALLLGLAIGYWSTGPRVSETETPAQVSAAAADTGTSPRPQKLASTQIKQIADQQAAPLLAKLRSDPRNPALLLQVGAIYYVAQQYQDATGWYRRAVAADPGNVAARNKLAGSLFQEGDVDGAIIQLKAALHADPTNANALYNLGAIELQGKGDARGALAAWQKLLRTNPRLSEDRKAAVLQLIAGVMTNLNDQHALEGARSDEKRHSKSE